MLNKDERMIGLTACSTDCDDMWQIGVDVLPEYRRKGIASLNLLAKDLCNMLHFSILFGPNHEINTYNYFRIDF